MIYNLQSIDYTDDLRIRYVEDERETWFPIRDIIAAMGGNPSDTFDAYDLIKDMLGDYHIDFIVTVSDDVWQDFLSVTLEAALFLVSRSPLDGSLALLHWLQTMFPNSGVMHAFLSGKANMLIKQVDNNSYIRVLYSKVEPWYILADILDAIKSDKHKSYVKNGVKRRFGARHTAIADVPVKDGYEKMTIISKPAAKWIISQSAERIAL